MNKNWRVFSISAMVVLVGAILVLPTVANADYVRGNGYGYFTQADSGTGSSVWVGDTPSCDQDYQINSHWTMQAAGQSGVWQGWANRVADEGLKAPYGTYYQLSAGSHTFTVTFYMQYRTIIDYNGLDEGQYTQSKIRIYGQVLDSYGVYLSQRQYSTIVDNIHVGSGSGVTTMNDFSKYATLTFTVSIPTSGYYKVDCGITAETHVKAGYWSNQHCGADLDLSPDGNSNEYCFAAVTNISYT